MLLAHHGFEGGHRAAVDVLTDALGEFMGNLGRMLRIYSDRYASSMSAEEMVLHTLHEGGGADVRGLENYIRNDVERSGTKPPSFCVSCAAATASSSACRPSAG